MMTRVQERGGVADGRRHGVRRGVGEMSLQPKIRTAAIL